MKDFTIVELDKSYPIAKVLIDIKVDLIKNLIKPSIHKGNFEHLKEMNG